MIRAWFARKRRLYAAEQMENVWMCWGIFFKRLHRPDDPGPRAMAENEFATAVWAHKRMVRAWWLP